MTTNITDQWIRKCELFVISDDETLALSDFRVSFSIQNADVDSPNNAAIRIYNLSKDTINKITAKNKKFKTVSLNAGYENGSYGVIFYGQVKQFRFGKEDAINVYLDILAADGDTAYNQGFVNDVLKSGNKPTDVINRIAKSMDDLPVDFGNIKATQLNTPSIRGKVLFGMGRVLMRNSATSLDCSWSIQNGRIQVVPNNGYLDDQIVRINSDTGLVGMPEQTDEGIRLKCLLNSKLRIGSLIEVDNSLINQIDFTGDAPVIYNSYKGLQPLAPLAEKSVYRVFVCEHEGDTRGNQWYTNLIGLAFDSTNKTTTPT